MKVLITIEYDTDTKDLQFVTRPKLTAPTVEALAAGVRAIADMDLRSDERDMSELALGWDGLGNLSMKGTRSPGDRVGLIGRALQAVAENELRGIEGRHNAILVVPASRLPAALGG